MLDMRERNVIVTAHVAYESAMQMEDLILSRVMEEVPHGGQR